MKIRPMEAELFRADRRKDGRTDGQTAMTKPIVTLLNFAKAPNSEENIKIGTK
jgi:hypothetical protein